MKYNAPVLIACSGDMQPSRLEGLSAHGFTMHTESLNFETIQKVLSLLRINMSAEMAFAEEIDE